MLAKEAVIVRDALDPSISEPAQRVREALEAKGLETPMVFLMVLLTSKSANE